MLLRVRSGSLNGGSTSARAGFTTRCALKVFLSASGLLFPLVRLRSCLACRVAVAESMLLFSRSGGIRVVSDFGRFLSGHCIDFRGVSGGWRVRFRIRHPSVTLRSREII